MSERRYVVELTKPVPASKLPAAAQEIARRLGLEVPRVVTLLQGRVGPVTKPVLAGKADAIAGVFQEAGVDVAVYDASAAPDQTQWPTEAPAEPRAGPEARPSPDDPGEPTAGPRDYQYGPVPALPPEIDRWDVDEPWGGMDPWRESAFGPREPADDDEVTVLRSSASRAPDEGMEPPLAARSAGEEPAPPEAGERYVPDPPVTAPADAEPDEMEDVPVAVRQTLDELPLPQARAEPRVRSGVWVAEPRRGDRRAVRVFLLGALAVAVALLVVLQLVFAVRGGAGATYEDGMAAYRSGDFAAARRAWEDAATAGSAPAEYMLGYLAQHGLGRPWSYREAVDRYAAAAAAGLPEAQLALGELYLQGLGVEPDAAAGAAWVELAAGAGHGAALHRLGELRFHGVGVAQDFDAALAAFAAAAERGSSKAADFLALAAHLRTEQSVSAP